MQLYAAKHSFDLTPGLVQRLPGAGGGSVAVALQREGNAQRGHHFAAFAQRHADAADAPGALLTLVGKAAGPDLGQLVGQEAEIGDGVLGQRVQAVVIQGLELGQLVVGQQSLAHARWRRPGRLRPSTVTVWLYRGLSTFFR